MSGALRRSLNLRVAWSAPAVPIRPVMRSGDQSGHDRAPESRRESDPCVTRAGAEKGVAATFSVHAVFGALNSGQIRTDTSEIR